MCGTVCNPSHNKRIDACNLQATSHQSADCKSYPPTPKLMVHRLSAYAEKISASAPAFTAFKAFTGLFLCTLSCWAWRFEGKGAEGTTRLSFAYIKAIRYKHTWGCVLLLKQFTIYQLSRQMLNDFLHLLNLCRCAILDSQPIQCTPPSLQKRHQNMPFP